MPDLRVTCPAVGSDGRIPVQYTCDGHNIAVPVAWTEPPRRTLSLVLIVDDPDAPRKNFVHWLIWNIPPDARRLPEGITSDLRGYVQGLNGFGKIGWGGPCPPHEHGPHRYVFHLFALDTMLPLRAGGDRSALEAALQGHVLAKTEFVASYQRREKARHAPISY